MNLSAKQNKPPGAGHQPGATSPPKDMDKRLTISCHGHEKCAWVAASRADHLKLQDWVRLRLNRAADLEGHDPAEYRADHEERAAQAADPAAANVPKPVPKST